MTTKEAKKSRAYGKSISEKKEMGYIAQNYVGDKLWEAQIGYYKLGSRLWIWEVDVVCDGKYFSHDYFNTIEEAEEYAQKMIH
jgi:hypothetical protein